jgi:hypothetical protein
MGLLGVFVDGMVWMRGLMKNSKSQEPSNLLSLGLESKDSRSLERKSVFEGNFVQPLVDPSGVDQAYVEQQFMGLLIYLGLSILPSMWFCCLG